jgi:hypothetical protein
VFTARHSTAQRGTARRSTAQHGAARHGTAQHTRAQRRRQSDTDEHTDRRNSDRGHRAAKPVRCGCGCGCVPHHNSDRGHMAAKPVRCGCGCGCGCVPHLARAGGVDRLGRLVRPHQVNPEIVDPQRTVGLMPARAAGRGSTRPAHGQHACKLACPLVGRRAHTQDGVNGGGGGGVCVCVCVCVFVLHVLLATHLVILKVGVNILFVVVLIAVIPTPIVSKQPTLRGRPCVSVRVCSCVCKLCAA